jgi:hypothetical protein
MTAPTAKELRAQEDTFEVEDIVEPVPPDDIVAYNELRSCADLFRMYSGGKLEIQPDFQREVVWHKNDQTRFIDSLVKQLPIPSMCFSLDYKTQHWKVIDGLQRMSSIIRFLDVGEWRLTDLHDIHPRLRHVTNLQLRSGTDEQQRLYQRVENLSIPVTVLRCDYSKKSHMRYLFTIFHRLNSGGMRLTNQEIRNCIYTGWYNSLLKTFDAENADWSAVQKRIWGKMDRYRSIEVLLRAMAFGEKRLEYDGNLARFLNDFMAEKTQSPDFESVVISKRLDIVAQRARVALLMEPDKKITLTLVEGVLVGLYVNNDNPALTDEFVLQQRYLDLKGHPVFKDAARYAVASAEKVKERLNAAVAVFAA